MQTYSYRGRRLFQMIIGVIGAVILALAVYDLAQDHSKPPREMKLKESQVIENLNRFLDEQIGRVPIDFFMLALGAWIAFFGLDGVLHRGPQLSFGPDGIRYFRFGNQIIPWDAFEHIRFIDRRRTSLLRSASIDLELKDPEPFAKRQPLQYRFFRRATHMFDPKTFTIHGYDIEVPLLQVARQMQEIAEPVLGKEDG